MPSPVVTCLLVAAVILAISGSAGVGLVVAAVCTAFEFWLGGVR